jgi:adenosine deaminase
MPKVEIHVHLEGATDAEAVWEMARRNGVALPVGTLEEWLAFYEFRDFPHFATVYVTAISSMRTPEDYSAMVESFLENQASQNVRYSEAYFSPQHHLGRNLSAGEILDALEQGAEAGRRKHGSRVRFIADVSRELRQGEEEVLAFAAAGLERNGLFVALGLGGIEVGNPPERFTGVFERAREAGLRLVAHAGETDGPASVWGAIHSLRAERIGHGVRSLDDESLIAYLRRTQLPLEVSPNSNYRLKVVPMTEPHPIRGLVDAGVFVTLNSDDPPMFSTDLNNEYTTLAGQSFTWEELWRLNLNTLEASFLPEPEKESFRTEWQAFAEGIPTTE